MKKITTILFLLFLGIPFSSFASDVEETIASVMNARPRNWEVNIDYSKRPYWVRSSEKCVELEMYGPVLGGYTYYNSSGEKISERRFSHEAIRLWITPEGYDTGWIFFNRLTNWFSPHARGFPELIGEYNGVKVFGEETYYAEKDKINEDSPKGTASAYFFPPPNGRTWQEWRSELQQTLKRSAPTNR